MDSSLIPLTKSEVSEEAIEAVVRTLRSGWLTNGPNVKTFETHLSTYFGGRHVRTFASGTSSLEIALRVAGIGPGDQVITTPISWVATANVILAVGATPVFVDVDMESRNLNLDQVETAISPKTKALLPVYLAGRPVDVHRLYEIAERHQLRVIEDAAQAIGSTWKGQRIGSFGDMASFSFQATKNLTTGEGGCLVFRDEGEALLAEKLRLQGVVRGEYDAMEVEVLGGKHNMTEIAAALGISQLKQIDHINGNRKRLAQAYLEAFGQDFEDRWNTKLPLQDTELFTSNWHLFQLVLPAAVSRTKFQEKMRVKFAVATGTHYPAIHLFKLYRERGFGDGMYPVAEIIGRQIVTLPLFNSMKIAEVQKVVDAVKSTLAELVDGDGEV